jgi:hypothetical protein
MQWRQSSTSSSISMSQGHAPEIQSAVIADLLATWLAGHLGPGREIETFRAELLADVIELVRRLVPVNEAAILARLRPRAH